MKIMLVDDEERSLTTMKKILARRGYDVVIANSGREALDKLHDLDIHVVILDAKMPGMDGIQTLEEIKKRFPLVEAIILTGHGTIETAVQGLSSGAMDYLTKPSNIDSLILKVEEAFEKRNRTERKIPVTKPNEDMKS